MRRPSMVSSVEKGRDTPADYRRVTVVLNFLKPCFFAQVAELVYAVVSNTIGKPCGFESHPEHQ